MLSSGLSRFHWVLIATVFCAGLVVWSGHLAVLTIVAAAFSLIVGLGVSFPQLQLFGPFVCRGNGARRRVALTFDDGPDPNSTPQLLELLGREKVSAAFFGVGERVAADPALAARIVRDGHLLENHSYQHSNLTNFFSVRRLRTELERTQAVIREAAGATPRWFRPPMGLSNPRVFKAAKSLSLAVIGWSARGLDTQEKDPEKVVDRIVRRVRPGAIILLHDGGIPAQRLVTTVGNLLERLRNANYEIVRLDELLAAGNPIVRDRATLSV